MFQRFYPDDYQNSTYEINYEELYKKGYRAIIFDIDNTLVPMVHQLIKKPSLSLKDSIVWDLRPGFFLIIKNPE